MTDIHRRPSAAPGPESPTPDLVFTYEDIQRARGRQPIVYVLRNASGRARYVGMSSIGLSRPLGRSHDAMGRAEPGDYLEVYACDGVEVARQLEAAWIHEFDPELNGARTVLQDVRQEVDDDDPLLTPSEASLLCGTSAETIRRWIRKGVVPVVRVGPYRRKRIRRSVALRYLVPEAP